VQIHRTCTSGKVVAYIDYADSWVENTEFAPVAGGYTLHVGYANGSGALAQSRTRCLWQQPGGVSYPVTGSDTWRRSSVTITLNAGWNTIRLTKGELYT
jgi:arabinan endo-1,5-alpha-L-arabinosidase